jgi:hypothetical protein
MCESQNGHLFLIKRIHTYRTHFEQVELRSHDALPTLKNFSCLKRNKNLDYIKMIQQVPRVLLYNMIYISKKEELARKKNHGAQFRAYCCRRQGKGGQAVGKEVLVVPGCRI